MPKNKKVSPYSNRSNLIAQATHITRTLASQSNLRSITDYAHLGGFVRKDGKLLLNLTSNDYLGLAQISHHITAPTWLLGGQAEAQECLGQDIGQERRARELAERFWEFVKAQHIAPSELSLGSGSSRSLSGGSLVWEGFEAYLQQCFATKRALLFNSGYHCNISCLCALGRLDGVGILIDEYAHASMFDGILQAKAINKSLWWKRFKHNDMAHLQELLESNAARFRHIIIVSEGVFSMDGDICDLSSLVALKNRYDNALLYLDEAHSIGVVGDDGLGLAKSLGLSDEVEFLVFTFGKALGSVGACMLCDKELRELFINSARGLIYSTALPPLNVAFSFFAFCELGHLGAQRAYLHALSKQARRQLEAIIAPPSLESKTLDSRLPYILGDLHIISLVLGENDRALECQEFLESCGIFARAIKSPTIPKGTARIRFSLNASHSTLRPLYTALEQYANRIS